ncbi:MAG: hypothetical protein PHQ76_04370 [Caldisericia bacterium]|jgi:succinylarginine dihydrolase|nr:hypothetical protein [Caldisericia bacterium]
MTKRMGSNIFLEEKIKIDDGLNDFVRRTYMIRKKYIDLIDRKAYWERRNKQDILDEILEQYFKDKEIKQFPK